MIICVDFSFPSVCAVLFLGCGMVWKDDVSDLGQVMTLKPELHQPL
jgi:hypothetical protein